MICGCMTDLQMLVVRLGHGHAMLHVERQASEDDPSRAAKGGSWWQVSHPAEVIRARMANLKEVPASTKGGPLRIASTTTERTFR